MDTSIIYNDYFLESHFARQLVDSLDDIGANIYLPRIVIDEAAHKYEEHLRDTSRQIEKLKRKTYSKDRDIIANEITEDRISVRVKKLIAYLEDVSHQVLDYPNISHREILERMFSGLKPFSSSKDKGYRDMLIWSNIRICALESDPEPVVFITQNTNDFCEARELHPDLKRDLIDNLGTGGEVEVIGTLKEFAESKINPRLEYLEGTVKEFNNHFSEKGAYWDIFESHFRSAGYDLIDWERVQHHEVNQSGELRGPFHQDDVEPINLKVIGALRGGESTLYLNIEGEFKFYIEGIMDLDEALSLEEEGFHSLIGFPSPYTAEVIKQIFAYLNVYVTFDLDTKEIVSHEVEKYYFSS